ncbi:MAG: transferase hexapeptide repeat containing protein [Gemmatimonadetes bacterium]|nr:transferase hexapeptide repeat containing protein [Gemmatimonadota bacterium]
MERRVAAAKNDPGYRLAGNCTDAQLATVVWYRTLQLLRGLTLRLRARGIRGVVFRGRSVIVEHAGQLCAGRSLILEDGVFINALSLQGISLGDNVTIARGAVLVCTGVMANLGVGITIGDRSAVGASSFLGGQGGIHIGDDVIMGPGVRIFSENHVFDALDVPIRMQGERRQGVAISNNCWIGAGALIVDGVSIGEGCVIAAGAVVTSSIPSWSIAAGVPARVIRSRQAPAEIGHAAPAAR